MDVDQSESLTRLEQIVGDRGDQGSVSIQRNPPTRHQTLPWSCAFNACYGTGYTLTEAIEDALADYDGRQWIS